MLLLSKNPEGVAVMLFYQVGEFFGILCDRSRKSIAHYGYPSRFCKYKSRDGIKEVSLTKLYRCISSVKPGEKVPLDGKSLTVNP